MFTVCPKCALTLVVTAADLRVAQGYVRCGRCLNVFNALARLSEERPAAGLDPSPPAGTAPSSATEDTGEIEVELDASILVTSVRPPAAPQTAAEPDASVQESSPEATRPDAAEPTGPTTVGDVIEPAAVADGIEPAVVGYASGHAATADAQTPEQPRATEPSSHVPQEAPLPERAASSSPSEAPDAQQTNSPHESPEGTFDLEARQPAAGLAWRLGACALAIALALQIVNHYRDALAANPALSGPLGTIYSALGVKLAPRWNIHAYDVRQLGASVAGAAAGEIVVRASVKNSADRAQPLPLLRVTLQDRFGNRIAARDVPPHDYLPSSVAPGSLLAAGSRVDATMVFVDPGPQAVGFEIDACLRQSTGEVACAHGP